MTSQHLAGTPLSATPSIDRAYLCLQFEQPSEMIQNLSHDFAQAISRVYGPFVPVSFAIPFFVDEQRQ